MDRFTPGPWIAEPMWGDFYVLADSGGMVADHHSDSSPPSSIARMRGIGRGRSKEEMAANARLIAAAPELLAALRSIVDANADEYRMLDKGIGTATDGGRRWLSARAAIAKATGA